MGEGRGRRGRDCGQEGESRVLESYCRTSKPSALPSSSAPEENVLSHVKWLLQRAGQTDSNSNVTFFPPLNSEAQTVCKATGLFLVFAGGRGERPREGPGAPAGDQQQWPPGQTCMRGESLRRGHSGCSGRPPMALPRAPPQAHCPSCLHSRKTGQGFHQKGEDMWAML